MLHIRGNERGTYYVWHPSRRQKEILYDCLTTSTSTSTCILTCSIRFCPQKPRSKLDAAHFAVTELKAEGIEGINAIVVVPTSCPLFNHG